MTEAISHDLLERFDVFKGLADEQLDRLRGAVDRCRFEPGEELITEGETNRRLFGLLEGRVEILKKDDAGEQRRLAVLDGDVVLGEHGFVLGERRTATVRALDPVDALCLQGEEFDRIDTTHDGIGRVIEHNILRMLAHRQTEINRELLGVLDETDGETAYHCDETNDLGDQLMRRWTV